MYVCQIEGHHFIINQSIIITEMVPLHAGFHTGFFVRGEGGGGETSSCRGRGLWGCVPYKSRLLEIIELELTNFN